MIKLAPVSFLKPVVALLALTLPVACAQTSDVPEVAEKNQPNILLLFADDLGWTDLGYRSGRWDTPNIDALKQQSLEFTRAYVASPTCSPSRASVITGQHPARLKMPRHIPDGKQELGFDKFHRATTEFHRLPTDPAQEPSRNYLPLELTSIAEAVKPLGYYTAFSGKWHLGSEEYFPVKQGFDEQFGVSTAGHPKSYTAPFWEPYRNPYPDAPKGKYLTERLTDDVVAFIKGYDKQQPFMLTNFYYTVHTPHRGPAAGVKKYMERGLDKRYANFGAMVEALDTSVGRILAALEESGQADNTIVIFYSDQGGYFTNAPLRGGKIGGMALYEGGARVPMLVRWPGVTKAGAVSEQLVLSTDILPTFVDIGGGEPGDFDNLDGQSMVPLIKGQSSDRQEVILYRNYEDAYAAVIGERWKLIAFVSGKAELYDLQNDPAESTDIAAKHPGRVTAMKQTLLDWQKDVGVAPELKRPNLL
ncbi:sulfatase [Shewanella corallii]|uniref:Sulfatase n=1 Tax=Shewanella corallii TaxID=560080 RepID=A0ABT0N5G6_9GAMM|nr:sulfatase [Shewanella corallii]MCL2913704.1 sulfatase [Shewanella corallii]